ncbi:LysR family transcriptional regulator [Aliiglaciecola litoralis]|uniref:LysR family transcriptional regulator n=1 Tax=Aliiglaciecola litoralis TaxID=582857 RepID=A0ABP3WZC8_9ALTE
MISYKQLNAFLTLAQSNTFAEAAEKIHLSQPALSSAIKKMEQVLGGKLFSRSTRKVALSREGIEFVPIARRLVHDWDTGVKDMQELFAMKRGKLTLAAMPSFASSLLPGILKSFQQHWQGINISIEDVVMEDVIGLVREGRAEIGFTFETELLQGLAFFPLMDNEFIAVMSSHHPLSKNKQLNWKQLAAHRFVAMNRGSSIRQWIDAFTAERGLTLDIVTEANQLSTLGELVKHDMGISVVPGICKQQFSHNDLVCRPISGANLRKKVGMIKTSRKSLSVPAQALWDTLIVKT